MALLSIANLQFNIGDLTLLDGVNLTLDWGDKIALVGRNGCGKSTLLKLIAGLAGHAPDAGQIQLARGAEAGYLEQHPNLDLSRTLREEAAAALADAHRLEEHLHKLADAMAEATGDELTAILKEYEHIEHQLEAMGGAARDHEVEATLHGLGLTDELFGVAVRDLSGGQKARLALAKLLLAAPDLLLLDEPTNHLDIEARRWLEDFLLEYTGAVILVSHDRWLLNRVVSRICELQMGRLEDYPGQYDQYRELRVERRLAHQRVFDKQQQRIKQEQAFIDRYRAGQRARQAKGREKRLERFKSEETVERPFDEDAMHLRFAPRQRSGDIVLTAEHLTKGYENKPLFKDFSIQIRRGDRIGVIGPNGAGKTTLIRCMLGETPVDSGEVRIGAALSVGHYRQTHEHLDLSQTVVEYLRLHVESETEQQARDLAGAFLFSGDEQDKQLGVLSGGERGRAVLAGLMTGGHNLLILDEPTNHLDIPSAERLEHALRAYTKEPTGWGEQARAGGGTLILITHDRTLLDAVVNKLIILDGQGGSRVFLGNYTQYIQALLAEAPPKPAAEPTRTAHGKSSRNAAEKRSGKNKAAEPATQKSSALTKLSQKAIEKRIGEIEADLGRIDAQLADPDTYRDATKIKTLQGKRQTLAAELAPLEEEWLRRGVAG